MNAGPNTITVHGEFFDAEGNSLGTKGDSLAPYSRVQWSSAFTRAPINAHRIEAGFGEV